MLGKFVGPVVEGPAPLMLLVASSHQPLFSGVSRAIFQCGMSLYLSKGVGRE